ncbi:MAG: Nudix family hydrolase [Zoogloea sp.]|uniref:Nudix family hydrolase n=1 Tax=Zoogloea sp. TaxID=49181 RepID=UPI00261F41E8|nr:Nudix family hydrolase [Zoogloea sp.]MDD3327291.1 Nudix family hydrolase [Zoogloea sp.]
MRKIVHVAAAVITRPDGSFLLGQRAPDTFYPGYWEFPGGKVEPGETPRDALIRELDEELGMQVDTAYPWITREHVYEHAHVSLHFFEVSAWRGEIHDRVHSALSWQKADAMDVGPMLPANGPILKALRLPRLFVITHAGEIGIDAQLARLDAALASGLRLVQIREPALPEADRERFARAVVERCHAAGALAVVNGDAALAQRTGADGLHLTASSLTGTATRPDFEWVGASCHTRSDLEKAASLELDYALLGAVKPTLSHPERSALGWPAFSEMITRLPMPVFALGGLSADDLSTAKAAGAHGVAGIRAIWQG